MTKDVIGHKLELVGLIFALIAALWQGYFVGWWDRTSYEWQSRIHSEQNYAILDAISSLAALELESDPDSRREKAAQLSLDASASVIQSIKTRDQRRDALDGQASIFAHIGFILMAISALSIITGKFLVYLMARSHSDSKSANKLLNRDS